MAKASSVGAKTVNGPLPLSVSTSPALLMQLSSFEAYSVECARLSAADPADAALHGHLRQVAGASRALFEAALEQVAIHEGQVLPP